MSEFLCVMVESMLTRAEQWNSLAPVSSRIRRKLRSVIPPPGITQIRWFACTNIKYSKIYTMLLSLDNLMDWINETLIAILTLQEYNMKKTSKHRILDGLV